MSSDREAVDPDAADTEPERKKFFRSIYAEAQGDAGRVPWADLAPKPELVDWLAAHPGEGRRAVDIACGLGDNAEAIADADYATTAFDLSQDAIDWARQRFPQSPVDYRQADMFDLPGEWLGAFDLVHECYTLQSMPPDMLDRTAASVASLVAPGGTLLIYARWREDGAEANGPPWPLERSKLDIFSSLGLTLESRHLFDIDRPGRKVPICFAVWRRDDSGRGA